MRRLQRALARYDALRALLAQAAREAGGVSRHRHGRAAPFRRNEELLNLLPKGVIAFPGSGITENLVDRARQLGIPVLAA